jgi:hypothetical protein
VQEPPARRCASRGEADLDHDRVQEHHGIDGIQRPGLPGPDVLQHLIGDPRDGRRGAAQDLYRAHGRGRCREVWCRVGISRSVKSAITNGVAALNKCSSLDFKTASSFRW